MNIKSVVFSAAVGVLFFVAGCSTQTEVQAPAKISKEEQELRDKQKSLAIDHFVDGSVYETKGQYAQAVIEYLDALRYDKDPAIYYELAKDYSILNKNDLASDAGRKAVQLDTANVDYHQLLAEIYVKEYQVDSAVAQYSKILALDSNSTLALFNTARLIQPVKPLEALRLYQRLLQLQGPDWEVLYQIADINSGLHQYDQAANAFEQMLKIDPDNEALQQNLAEMYARAEKYDQADSVYSELLARDSDNVELHGALGELYLQQNDWDKARSEFNIVLQSDSLTADARFRIALAYFTQLQKDSTLLPETMSQFTTYLKDYPDDWRPMFYLGVLNMMSNNDSTALQYFDKVTKIASWNADAWNYMGSLYFEQKDYSQMVSIMEKARELLPDDARVNFLLGLAYTRVDRNEDAIVALKRSVELNPKDVNVLSTLGLTYDNMKRYKDCDTVYEEALKVDPHYALVLNNYAYSLAERGEQLDRAYAMSKESLEKDSANASYLDTFAWVLFKMGRYQEAQTYEQKAIDQGDVTSVLYEHLGDIYSKMDQSDMAKKFWTKALDLDSKNTSLKEKIERGKL
jgi:tetratricopeptide (TPR) repeat protein